MTVKDVIFVVFDLETTGIDFLKESIVELGAIKFSLTHGIIDEYSSFINPEKIMSDEVIQIHGITNEMVKDAPLISSILPEFSKFISETILLAHNAEFDVNFLNASFKRSQLMPPKNPVLDTLLIAQQVLPKDEYKGLYNYRLQTLKRFFNIQNYQAHRSIGDCMTTYELFRILMSRYFNASIAELMRDFQVRHFESSKEQHFSSNLFSIQEEQLHLLFSTSILSVQSIDHELEALKTVFGDHSGSNTVVLHIPTKESKTVKMKLRDAKVSSSDQLRKSLITMPFVSHVWVE